MRQPKPDYGVTYGLALVLNHDIDSIRKLSKVVPDSIHATND